MTTISSGHRAKTSRTAGSGTTSPPTMIIRRLSKASGASRISRVKNAAVMTSVVIPRASMKPANSRGATGHRGGTTTVPPLCSAPQISNVEPSNAPKAICAIRSDPPSGTMLRSRTSCAIPRCRTSTPLGLPVEPDVKNRHARCSTRTDGIEGSDIAGPSRGIPRTNESGTLESATSTRARARSSSAALYSSGVLTSSGRHVQPARRIPTSPTTYPQPRARANAATGSGSTSSRSTRAAATSFERAQSSP